ncbi:MAG: TrkH family potassium uptake protein [Lachnospira sp.]
MKKKSLSTTRIIMLGFLLGAFIGAILLYLPICLKPEVELKFLDALFISTSSICVTGLSTVNIGMTFSFAGQVVLLILIQLGGLGIVTFTTLLLMAFHERITLQDRLLLRNAYNLDTLSGLVRMTIQIVKTTLIIELLGAFCYSFVFIPEYGVTGVWYSIFHSVSAFCNAGIDLLGGNSFCEYRDNILINLTTMTLIITGGLGFPVFWEIGRLLTQKKGSRKKMNFHARLVLIITGVLLVSGMFITLVLEYDNPATIGTLDFPHKLLASAFQSVTLRTAGFATIDQGLFRPASCMIYLLFMFIGGSPAGTAGGVKTVTFVLMACSVITNIKGKNRVCIMKRTISDAAIKRCVAIICFSFSIFCCLSTAMLILYPNDILAVLYEVSSAIGTVGLSRGLTGNLNSIGKIIIIIAMYLGRVGPISLALAFNSHKNSGDISYAEAKVIIG